MTTEKNCLFKDLNFLSALVSVSFYFFGRPRLVMCCCKTCSSPFSDDSLSEISSRCLSKSAFLKHFRTAAALIAKTENFIYRHASRTVNDFAILDDASNDSILQRTA